MTSLPEMTGDAVSATVALSRAAGALSGLPLFHEIQQVAGQAQTIMEDVHNEATELFTVLR